MAVLYHFQNLLYTVKEEYYIALTQPPLTQPIFQSMPFSSYAMPN